MGSGRFGILAAAVIVAALVGIVPPATAAEIGLFDWGIHLDGTTYCLLGPCDISPGVLPPSTDASLFDFTTGLGEIAISFAGSGSHYVSLFLDLEIDAALNTYFNEWGAGAGVAAAGQTWEIDEPGYVFGDIYDHWLDGNLEGTNGVPAALPDDVSLALASSFALSPGTVGSVSFLVSETAPSSGFYLSQTDPDSGLSLYFSSGLAITEVPGVPEPLTARLLIGGVVWLVTWTRRRGHR
jgi:hypothetical protein